MDWGAANAAMKAVRGYQDAFKQGRMDLVEKQKQLYESAMQTLQTGTNIQQMRQTMGISGKQQQMAEEMFPLRKEQAEVTIASTKAGTEATKVGTTGEQQKIMAEAEDRKMAKQRFDAVRSLAQKFKFSIDDPIVAKYMADIAVNTTSINEAIEQFNQDVIKERVETEKAKLGAEKATSEVASREMGIRKQISETTIEGAIEGGLKADIMKPDIEQKRMDLSSAYIRQIDNAISMDEYFKIAKKNEMEANAIYAKAKAQEALSKEEKDKMEEYKARQILQKSLEDAGIEKDRARLKAITIELPDKLKQNIKDAEKQKQLASENDQAGIRGSIQIMKARGVIPKDATTVQIDKTMIIEAMDTLIAEWKSDLLLWGPEYEYGEARTKEKAKEASMGEGSPELNKQLDSFNW